MTDPDESLSHARDAYSSAIFLVLLVLCGGLLRFASAASAPGSAPWLHVVWTGAAVASLATLLATRQQPLPRLALVVCALFIALYLPISLWGAAGWRLSGRPFEAFKDPHVIMCSLGLVVPRSFRVGVAALVVYCLASLGIYYWLVSGGTPRALLPSTEPAASIVAALVGVAVLWARKCRRDQTRAYLRVEAEAAALFRLCAAFGAIRKRLCQQLSLLDTGLAEVQVLEAGAQQRIELARRSVARLGSVCDRLSSLAPSSSVAPSDCKQLQQAAADKPARLTPDELTFYARDANAIARVMSWMTLGLALAVVPMMVGVLPAFVLALWSLTGLVGFVSLIILYRTRARPSETLGVALAFAVTVPWFVIIAFTQPAFAAHQQAFEPLLGLKMGIVLMPLLLPRRWWISYATMGLLVVEALALFYVNHFDRMRDRIPASEPWSILIYCLIGCALVLTREHRRVASLRLLRAERDVVMLAHHAALANTVLDQMGSPLQVLAINVGLLLDERPSDEQLRRMHESVRTLSSLRDRITNIDAGADRADG
jgi:hypothetical protein